MDRVMKSSIVLLVLMFFSFSLAWDGYGWGINKGYKRPYKDFWGNSYKNYNNMWRDDDGDGILNYYDYNDRNPNIQTPYQKFHYRRKNSWGW